MCSDWCSLIPMLSIRFQEISKKASKLEAGEVERSSLAAQVSILKRELATARDDLSRRGNGGPADLQAEVERLRGKRDREYQRRKRVEADLDEMEKEVGDLKQRLKRAEETPKAVVRSRVLCFLSLHSNMIDLISGTALYCLSLRFTIALPPFGSLGSAQ